MPYEINFIKKTHQYFINDKELISVSKILNNYFGNSYENVPTYILARASLRGKSVHKVAELYFNNIKKFNVVELIKEKIKFLINLNTLTYCNTLLDYLEKEFTDNQQYITEKPYWADIVAGTPDLIFKNQGKYSIIDYKTYKSMTKELKLKAELQLTAYHWILIRNGFDLGNTHYIYWVNQDKLSIIPVEITQQKIHEWEMALALYKNKGVV